MQTVSRVYKGAPVQINQIMVGTTGAGVFTVVLTMSVFTVVGTSKELKKIKTDNTEAN